MIGCFGDMDSFGYPKRLYEHKDFQENGREMAGITAGCIFLKNKL